MLFSAVREYNKCMPLGQGIPSSVALLDLVEMAAFLCPNSPWTIARLVPLMSSV